MHYLCFIYASSMLDPWLCLAFDLCTDPASYFCELSHTEPVLSQRSFLLFEHIEKFVDFFDDSVLTRLVITVNVLYCRPVF
jgi:hypothetical protein